MNRGRRALGGLVWLLCAVMVVLFALAANAQDDDDDWGDGDDEIGAVYAAPMKYVTFGLIAGFEDFDSVIGDNGDDKKGYLKNTRNITDEPVMGFQAKFGNRAMEYLAFEGEFQFLSNIDFKADRYNGAPEDSNKQPIGQPKNVDAYAWMLTFNIKVFPFHDLTEKILEGRLQPYVIGGAGGMAASGLSIDTPLGLVVKGGAGAQYFLDQHVSLHAESTYSHPFQQVEGLNMWQVIAGFSLHFD